MQLRFDHWQGITALLLASALAGCSTVELAPPPLAAASAARPAAHRALPELPPAGSGRGGYYKDDGPGDNPPDGLHDMPDAEPKVEPYSTRGNKPYVVFGKSYAPFVDDRPLRQRGRGSWYGKKFHGQKTSSGEPYDMYKMSAAHPTLPIPSYARVTNTANGRQVIVRVNDRGPFHSGRIIDLSYTAALKLGYVGHGSAELEVERLLPDEIERMAGARQSQAQPAPVPADAVVAVTALPAEIAAAPVVSAAGLYLQLGAFTQADNAEAVRLRLAQNWAATLPPLQVVQIEALYRVYSGPFDSRTEANSVARQIQAAGVARPVVVER